MSPPRFTEADVERLLASGRLAVDGNYTWDVPNSGHWAKVSLSVRGVPDGGGILRIAVSVNLLIQSKRSYALLWNNHRVRALCLEGSHENRHTDGAVWRRSVHKHAWRDDCDDRYAYIPTDITASDVLGQLRQFCAECKVACNVTLAPLPPLPAAGLFGGPADEV
jgi:hypothetical protein